MGKKKRSKACDEMPAWLITFSDMMTLMLTFFVLLVSMATIDERRQLIVLGSIIGTFGHHQLSVDPLAEGNNRSAKEPGPMTDVDDLEPLKDLLWEDAENDLRFQSNRFVQILSISADVLFEPDSTTLSARGQDLLGRISPVLARVDYPLLLAGHTSTLRDELGLNYTVGDDDVRPDISWMLSMNRALSVYRYLMDQGVNPDMMRVEAFGRFRPRYNTNTPEGRSQNRSVDIVLDKRSTDMRRELQDLLPPGQDDGGRLNIDGFEFDVNKSGNEAENQAGNEAENRAGNEAGDQAGTGPNTPPGAEPAPQPPGAQ